MKKTILIIILCALIISTMACGQAQTPPAAVDTTPDNNSVTPPVNSPGQTSDIEQNDLLGSMTPAAFSPYDVPAHVTGEHPFDALSVSFNADVTVPEVTSYPVVKMQRRTMTNDEIFAIVELLADTTNGVYGKWDAPKDQWQSWIDEAKQYRDEPWMNSSYLDSLKEYYNAAEEKVIREPIALTSITQGTSEQTFYVPSDDGITAHKFQVFADGFAYTAKAVSAGFNGLQTYVIRARDVVASEFQANFETREQFLWRSPSEPELSQEDARAKAVQLLNDMGFGDLTVSYAEPCCFLDRYVNKTTGWAFTFTRDVSGLNVQDEKLSGSQFISNDATPAYFAPWGRERVIIAIAKDGVRGMTIRGISSLSGTEIESVHLLPFETMQECIAKTLNQMYAAQLQAENSEQKGVIEVTSVLLGTSLIADEGHTDEGYYVPSWIVSYSLMMTGGDYSGQIIFNAADGSYIEPRMTAQDLGR